MERKVGRQKKRYGLLMLFLLINWLAVAWVVWKVDPEDIKNIIIPGIYLPMLVLVFGALFLLFSILFLSAKRALRWAGGVSLFLLLRFLGLGSILNGGLILGVLVAGEYYLARFEPKKDVEEREDLTNEEE